MVSRVHLGRIQGQAGFTLIELLGVALIVILLALMALPIYAEVTDKGRHAKTSEDLRIVEQALEAYKADPVSGGHYPERLRTLVERGYLKPTELKSPWYSEDNEVYYYYAVNKDGSDAATAYILGDPGPDASCGRSTSWPNNIPPNPSCGVDPYRGARVMLQGSDESPSEWVDRAPKPWVFRSSH